jgi:hypothetical protein
MRYLMDVIPLDASLVRGSHGIAPSSPMAGPLFISDQPDLLAGESVQATDVCGLILQHLTGEAGTAEPLANGAAVASSPR